MDDRRQLRQELAVIFRLIRKERPDLARKLHKAMTRLGTLAVVAQIQMAAPVFHPIHPTQTVH